MSIFNWFLEEPKPIQEQKTIKANYSWSLIAGILIVGLLFSYSLSISERINELESQIEDLQYQIENQDSKITYLEMQVKDLQTQIDEVDEAQKEDRWVINEITFPTKYFD